MTLSLDNFTKQDRFPKWWEQIKLVELANVKSGGTPSTFEPEYWEDGTIPWINSGKLDNCIVTEASDHITKLGYDKSHAKLFPKNTVLMALTGSTTGKVGLLDFDSTTNQSVTGIFPSKFYDPWFLFYYLIFIRPQVLQKAGGSAQPHINQKIVENIEMPLPPFGEQVRIAGKVKALFEQQTTVVSHLTEIQKQTRQFRASLLRSAFLGSLTSKWRKKNLDLEPVEEFLDRIRQDRENQQNKQSGKKTRRERTMNEFFIIGKNKNISTWVDVKLENIIYMAGRIGWRGLKADEYTESGPLLLSAYNITYGEEVDFTDSYHVSTERYRESPEIQLQENDILLVKDGAGIGRVSIAKNLKEPATVNSSLLVIRSGEAVLPNFLFYFFCGPELQTLAKSRITGSATPHLFQHDIKEFVLPVPSLKEQEEIVRILGYEFKILKGVEDLIRESIDVAKNFRESILWSAFTGKLSYRNTQDESAKELLEKIKQERVQLKGR